MKTGTYHIKIFDWNDRFVSKFIRVEILDETEKSYLIKYLQVGAFRDGIGTKKWVRKHNIKLDRVPIPNPNIIRLPYKD